MKYDELKKRITDFKSGRQRLVYVADDRVTLKTRLGESKEFLDSELAKQIEEQTSFLPDEADVYVRMKAVFNRVEEVPRCPVCGDDCKLLPNLQVSKPMFAATCEKTHCKMSHMASQRVTTDESRRNHSIAQKRHRAQSLQKLQESVSSEKSFTQLGASEVKERLQMLLSQRKCNGVVLKDSDIEDYDFFKSILKLTEFIEIPSVLSSRDDLKLNERTYCILNDITERQRCKFCGSDVKFISLKNGYALSCSKCFDDKYREKVKFPTKREMLAMIDKSKHEEREIRTFVNQIYAGRVNVNDRTVIAPYELDIVLPEVKLAIEFDGLYWHNDEAVKQNYHLKKTEMCERAGYHLVHIFESEWKANKDIVKSRLKNLLGVYDKTVFARKCIVKLVSSRDSKVFQQCNHIQGHCQSSVNLGLYDGEELISLMTFGKCRFDKKHEWELVRFCNKLGYHVPGAAGKLLKFFERNYQPKSLVSYADRRWSQGKLYEALGFKLDYASRPNYWYYRNGDIRLQSRVKFQKHKLKSILTTYDPSASETLNMKSNGYLRIFDCGNLVFSKLY